MSSITYHYGGKEGLYAAAVAHIDATMAEEMNALMPVGPVPTDPDAARAEIHLRLDRLFTKFLGDENAERSLFVMREQMHPSPAFDRFFEGTMGQMAIRLTNLVAAATGVGPTDARIAAITLFGQLVVWRASRALADRLLGAPIDADVALSIRRHIAANTDCILDRLSADQQEPQ